MSKNITKCSLAFLTCPGNRISAIQAQEPLSGETVLLDMEGDTAIAGRAKELSRNIYGRKPQVVEVKNKISVGTSKTKSIKQEKSSKATLKRSTSSTEPQKADATQ